MAAPATRQSAAETRERILVAAEAVLRRHGPAKLAVVDVARALGMSHANIYRHFASRTALLDALVERWLHQVSAPLAEIAGRPGTAAERLRESLRSLISAKRKKVLADPELFDAYHEAASEARQVVEAYLAEARGHLARILRDGAESGEFVIHDLDGAVVAVRDALVRFVEPVHIRKTIGEAAEVDAAAERVMSLLIAGLRSGAV